MTEIITMQDADLQESLQSDKPHIILFSNGDGLRGDFTTAMKKEAEAHPNIVFARINPDNNPQTKEQFNVGSKALMIAVNNGEVITRRNRPWGPDVADTVAILKAAIAGNQAVTTDDATIKQDEDVETTNTDNKIQKEEKTMETTTFTATDENFQAEVIDHDLPVVVDFWAEWCGPCRMVGPILDKLAVEYAGKLRIAKVNVDENPGLSQHFQVMSIPTIMMLKERHIVFSQPGALPEAALRDLFDQLVALEIDHEGHDHEQEEEAEATEQPAD